MATLSRLKPLVIVFLVLSFFTVGGIVKQGFDLEKEKSARVAATTISEARQSNADARQDKLARQAKALAMQVESLGKTPVVSPSEISGPSGSQGSQGVQGLQGVPGPTPTFSELTAVFASYCGARRSCKGPKGDTGANGIDGKNGVDGKAGKDGVDGKDGKNGSDGVNGTNGSNGVGIATVTCDPMLGGPTLHVTLTDGTVQDVPCS